MSKEVLTKEEFEVWIEEDGRLQEAFDKLPHSDRTLDKWLKSLALSFAAIAKEEAKDNEDVEEEGSLSDDLDDELDSEDEEEEAVEGD